MSDDLYRLLESLQVSRLNQSELSQLLDLPGEIRSQIEGLLDRRIQLIREIAALEDAGIVEASPYYRDEQYLYLIHPTQPDGSREREYIGNKPEKVQAALSRVERFKEHERKVRDLHEVEATIKFVINRLEGILNILRSGDRW